MGGITANLTNANLSNSYLFETNLTGANLSGADLTGSYLRYAILTDVAWSNTTCPDGSNSDTNGLNACVALVP